jgi:tetratricopeptide (TPR) repeat protein
LTRLGVEHRRAGRYQQAADHHRQALGLFREINNRGGETQVLNSLGEALLAAGQPDHARIQHDMALTLADQAGDRYEQARAHDGLAHTHHATGDIEQAHQHWQQALAIYFELGTPEADEVHAHLAGLDAR